MSVNEAHTIAAGEVGTEDGAVAVADGTWRADALHSSIEFSISHLVVSRFRGRIDGFNGALEARSGELALEGSADVANLGTGDETLDTHLRSPEFFDSERHPRISFSSSAIRLDERTATVNGEMTIRGTTRPVIATGTLAGPVVDLGGADRIGLELETTFDRHEFGLDWNAPLPRGGFALSSAVTVSVHLELVREA